MTHTQEQIDAVAKAMVFAGSTKWRRERGKEYCWNVKSPSDKRRYSKMAIAALDAMPAKEAPKRKMKITHFPEGFDGKGAVIFDNDAPKPDITVQEAARVILESGKLTRYDCGSDRGDAKFWEDPSGEWIEIEDLRALSEGEG